MTGVVKPRLPQPVRSLGLLGAASLAAIAALIPIYRSQGLPWAHAIAAAFIVVVPGALLGGTLWRYLIARNAHFIGKARLGLATHLLQAVAFSATWVCAIAVLSYAVHPAAAAAFLHNGAVWQFIGGLITYGAIAAGARSHAIQIRLKAQELAMANAELQALRARLEPHFLFNTLHSLTQLSREDPGATEDALERFGELMRYVLDAGRDAGAEVALEDEIAFVHHYLALERLRLGNRLRVEESLDPEALELGIPPLLLQPLVENAVRHGLAPQRAGGTLRLAARLMDGALAITVADDGAGASDEAWRHTEGLGLNAVRQQLKARYAQAAQMTVETRPGAGFAAHIHLPAHLPGEDWP